MIIECQACRARFKLDESRIKGKGARIRCREREPERGPSPVEEVTPPPPPVEREQEPFAREPVESHEEPAPAPRDEVDAAFDRLLPQDREWETEEPVPAPDAEEPGSSPSDA